MHATRRTMLALVPAALLAACSTDPTTGKPQPPTLDDVKNWLQTASQELPTFIQELGTTGALKPDALAQAQAYLAKFQVLVTSVMQLPPGADPTTLINDIGSVVSTIMTFIPQAAPFAPLVIGLQLLLQAFLARKPVSPAQATPPKPASLARMHAETRALRR